MYLFCVELDLALEQTAGLIDRETKGLYLPIATWLRQPWCLWSSFAAPAMAAEPSRGNEEPQPTLYIYPSVVVLHSDCLSLGHVFFNLALHSWEITGPILLPPSIPFLLTWSEFKNNYCLCCPGLDMQHTWKAGPKQCTGAGCQNTIFLCWSFFKICNGYSNFFVALISLIDGWLKLLLITTLPIP